MDDNVSTPVPTHARLLRCLHSLYSRLGRWAVLIWILVGAAVVVAADLVIGTPRGSEIRSLADLPRATTVYDMHGQPAFTVFKERRIEVPLAQISPDAVRAVLAIEDQRFHKHRGIDLWRVGGALLANLRSGEPAQGGSTITQQLGRKSFLTDEKTIRRKLKEMLLALRIERQFTKDQILELYLNKIYFGDGLYGIEAAARGYFGKSANALNLDEAALLAGLIQAPSAYAPTAHPGRALARRAVVLGQMVEAGFIDRTTAASVERAPLRLKNGLGQERSAQYYKNHVTRLLVDRFGWEMVSEDGLRVFTTLDPTAQRAAEATLARGLADAEKNAAFRQARRQDRRPRQEGDAPDYLQGALVAIDPSSGEVRALVGGRDFDASQFDRATQARRQAGSAFKPFIYAAAIDLGYSPATLVTGLDDPMLTAEGAWVPEDEHSAAAAMTVRTALRTSSNRAAVQVLRAVGIPRAVTYAERLGLDAPAVPSLALGAGDVSLLSMTAAYGAFANGGWLRPPVVIRRVEDKSGRVLFAERLSPTQVVTEETAFLMAQMLADVVDRGTGYRVRQVGFRQPAAGKTGTTNEYRDAWFVGFTPAIVAGVWVGFDEPRTIMRSGYAGEIAAPIWGRFMREIIGNREGQWLARPEGIVALEVCRVSGARPTEGCRRVITVGPDGAIAERSQVGMEYFRRGTEPYTECPIHRPASFIDGVGTIIGAAHEASPETRKKKGFWGRFIGVFKGGGG